MPKKYTTNRNKNIRISHPNTGKPANDTHTHTTGNQHNTNANPPTNNKQTYSPQHNNTNNRRQHEKLESNTQWAGTLSKQHGRGKQRERVMPLVKQKNTETTTTLNTHKTHATKTKRNPLPHKEA